MKILALALCSAALVAQDAAPFRILGRVTDLEGRPVPRAEITLKVGSRAGGKSFWSDGEGRFALQTTARGYITLLVHATGRQSAQLPMLQVPGGEIRPEFRLPLIPWVEPKGPTLPLWGTLNGETLPKDAKLSRQGDGTWAWQVAAKDGSVLKAAAAFGGYVTHPGHTANRYADGSNFGEYLPKGGLIRFVLDPRKMGKAGEKPSVAVPAGQDGFRQAMGKVGRVHERLRAMLQKGAPSAAEVEGLVALLQAEADAAPKGLATCYHVGQVQIYGATQRALPKALVQKLTADFGYDNYLWEASDTVRSGVLDAAHSPKEARRAMAEADKRQGSRYADQFMLSGLFNGLKM